MALTTRSSVLLMPGMSNAGISVAWLDAMIDGACQAIKTYCKRDLDPTFYTEYLSGLGQRDLWLRQWPVLTAQTTIASSSNGLVLPQATIDVASTVGFPSGDLNPTIAMQTSLTTWTTVSYTGTTATSFTGCSGGTGTLSSTVYENRVASPVVSFDPSGYGGQSVGAFADQTIMVQGSQFMVEIDNGGSNKLSYRGLLRATGGSGGWAGYNPQTMWGGKLAGSRMPTWPRGDFNIRVCYAAGYTTIPADLQVAANTMVAQLARTMPTGANLTSEGLGSYNYSILIDGENPAMGDIRRILAPYRESSWGD